jgi:hypothetical protein
MRESASPQLDDPGFTNSEVATRCNDFAADVGFEVVCVDLVAKFAGEGEEAAGFLGVGIARPGVGEEADRGPHFC